MLKRKTVKNQVDAAAAQRVGEIEAQLDAQHQRLDQAVQESETLEKTWSVAALAADVDGVDNAEEIARIEAEQDANRREQVRADNAITELKRRLQVAQVELERLNYERDCEELARLFACNGDMEEEYRSAAIAHVDAAHAIRKHTSAMQKIYGRVRDYALSHGERPPHAAWPSLPKWFDLYLNDEAGPDRIRQAYADTE